MQIVKKSFNLLRRKNGISLLVSLALITSLTTAQKYIVTFDAEAYQVPTGMTEIQIGEIVSFSFLVGTGVEDSLPSNEIIGEYSGSATEISLHINNEELISSSFGDIEIENDFAGVTDSFTLRASEPNISFKAGDLGVFTPTIIQFRNTTSQLSANTTSSDELIEATFSLQEYEFSTLSIRFESSDTEIQDGQINFEPISGSYKISIFPELPDGSIYMRNYVSGLKLSHNSEEQKSYQLYESINLLKWDKVGAKIRGNGLPREVSVQSTNPVGFYRFSIEDIYSDSNINETLADQILGDGLLVEPGTYQKSNNGGSFSLKGFSEGIEIITEGTWTWTVSDSDFDTVIFSATISRYDIPYFNFSGSPQSFATTFGTPAPVKEEATIKYTGFGAGYFDSEIHYTDNSREQEPREYFNGN